MGDGGLQGEAGPQAGDGALLPRAEEWSHVGGELRWREAVCLGGTIILRSHETCEWEQVGSCACDPEGSGFRTRAWG